MTGQPTQTSVNAGRSAVMAIVLPSLLIAHFLWNLLTPAHEYPMRSEQVMTMTFDGLMLAGLFGLKASIPKLLFWTAVVAGVGLFVLRLTGDAARWTGHLVYYRLLPAAAVTPAT